MREMLRTSRRRIKCTYVSAAIHRADIDVRNPRAGAVPLRQNSQMSYVYKTMKSPVGRLTLVGSDRGLAAVLWEHDDPTRVRLGALTAAVRHPTLRAAQQQLQEYFAGKRRKFT